MKKIYGCRNRECKDRSSCLRFRVNSVPGFQPHFPTITDGKCQDYLTADFVTYSYKCPLCGKITGSQTTNPGSQYIKCKTTGCPNSDVRRIGRRYIVGVI